MLLYRNATSTQHTALDGWVEMTALSSQPGMHFNPKHFTTYGHLLDILNYCGQKTGHLLVVKSNIYILDALELVWKKS